MTTILTLGKDIADAGGGWPLTILLLAAIGYVIYRDHKRDHATMRLVAAKEEQIKRIARECAVYRRRVLGETLSSTELDALDVANGVSLNKEDET